MSETDQEQLDYGNVTCVHGMNLGTSGGADFMCGDCESGFTKRVECDTCGDVLWLQHEQRVVNCYPSVERWKEARFMRETIADIRASDTGMTNLIRRVILDTIKRIKMDTSVRDHNYNKEAQL
jgi:hypothetical protein